MTADGQDCVRANGARMEGEVNTPVFLSDGGRDCAYAEDVPQR